MCRPARVSRIVAITVLLASCTWIGTPDEAREPAESAEDSGTTEPATEPSVTTADTGPVGWCGKRTAATPLPNTDYQCVDFDEKGLPDDAIWVPQLAGSGGMQTTKTVASSLPASMSSSVSDAKSFDEQDTAALEWTPVGANAVELLVLRADINPDSFVGVSPPWTGSVALLCVATGDGDACLRYTKDLEGSSSGDYTGLLVEWQYWGGPAFFGQCEVSEDLTNRLWNSVELSLDPDSGDIGVLVDGVDASKGCTGVFSLSTEAKFGVGLQVSAVTTNAWTVHFDNVEATVTRR